MKLYIQIIFCIVLIQYTSAIGKIQPTKHIQLGLLNSNQKGYYTLSFQTETKLNIGDYIRINISDFSEIYPETCYMKFNQINLWEKCKCYTYQPSSIPTVEEKQTLWIELPEQLLPGVENELYFSIVSLITQDYQGSIVQIQTQTNKDFNNPVIYDQNLNFGSVSYIQQQPISASPLNAIVLSFGPDGKKIGGSNELKFSVSIDVKVGEEISKGSQIKIVLPLTWAFISDKSIVSVNQTQNRISNEVNMIEYKIENPNQMQIIFDNYLEKTTQFEIQVTNIQNPLTVENQGGNYIKVFTMPLNKNQIYEQINNLQSLETEQIRLDVDIFPSINLPFTGPIKFYKGMEQYIRIQIKCDKQIPPQRYLQLQFVPNGPVPNTIQIIPGTLKISSSLRKFDIFKEFDIQYNTIYQNLRIGNLDLIQQNQIIELTMKVLISSQVGYIHVKCSYNELSSQFNINGDYLGENDTSNSQYTSYSQDSNFDLEDFNYQGIRYGKDTNNAFTSYDTRMGVATFEGISQKIFDTSITNTNQNGDFYNAICLNLGASLTPNIQQIEIYMDSRVSVEWEDTQTIKTANKDSNFQYECYITQGTDKSNSCPNNINNIFPQYTNNECTYETKTVNGTQTYSLFTIKENSAQYFKNCQRICLNHVKVNEGNYSNSYDDIYDTYIKVTYTDSSTKTLLLPLIIQGPDVQDLYLSTLVNTSDGGNLPENDQRSGIPTLLNIVNDNTINISNILVSENQTRVMILYSQNGFQNLLGNIQDKMEFSCGSNIDLTCKLFLGQHSIDNIQKNYFTNWDRIVIYLSDEASLSKFHIIIPDIVINDLNGNYANFYKLALGKYDHNSDKYYVYHHQIILLENNFNEDSVDIIAGNFPSQLDSRMNFITTGESGSESNGLEIQIYTTDDHIGNDNSKFGAGVILITDWQLWVNGLSQYTYIIDDIITNDKINVPVSLSYQSYKLENHYITLLPLINIEHKLLGAKLYLDKILLPYSNNLPQMKILVTDQNGNINTMNTIINGGSDQFFQSYLKSTEIQCQDFYQGIKNTICQFSLQPYSKVQGKSSISIIFDGLKFNQFTCQLIYNYNLQNYDITSYIQCELIKLNNQLIVTIDYDQNFPQGSVFYLEVTGVEIVVQKIHNYLIAIQDFGGQFTIEQFNKNFIPGIQKEELIKIEEIKLAQNNYNVITDMSIIFYIPRKVTENEYFVIDLTNSWNGVNDNIFNLNIKLLRNWNKEIINIGTYFQNNQIRFEFEDINDMFEDFYELIIYNIHTPENSLNYKSDYIKIQYKRKKDDSIVIQNLQENTSLFPDISFITNQQIYLTQSQFLLEGGLSTYTFILQCESQLNKYQSVVTIVFPFYYSINVSNFYENDLVCQLDDIPIQCFIPKNNPYQLKLINFPKIIYANTQFIIEVFGINVGSKKLRLSSKAQSELIFIGVQTDSQSTVYDSYNYQIPPDIKDITDFGSVASYVFLNGIHVSDKFSRYLSRHILTLQFTQDIGNLIDGYIVSILFPKEYNILQLRENLICDLSEQITVGGQKIDSYQIQENQNCIVKGRQILANFTYNIDKSNLYQISFEAVPTPQFNGVVDFNKIKIQIYDKNSNEEIMQSFYQSNKCKNINFTSPQDYLKVNDDEIIQITKGTYSKNLKLTTFDKNIFKQNLKVYSEYTGFNFYPNPFFANLGTYESEFRLGVDYNTQHKRYSLGIEKTEKTNAKLYELVNNILVEVISDPVIIEVPIQIVVPLGGCSLPQKLKLENSPYYRLEIGQQYDKVVYTENLFMIDHDFSDQFLHYNRDVDFSYYSFCIGQDFEQSNLSNFIELEYILAGENQYSYELSNSKIEIQVTVKEKNPNPSSQLNLVAYQKTWATFDVFVTVDGTLFWELFIINPRQNQEPQQLKQLKENIKEHNTILKNFNSHLQRMETIELDHRIGLQVTYSKDFNSITIDNLMPENDYKLCLYYQDEFKQITKESGTCLTFTTFCNIFNQLLNFVKNIQKAWEEFAQIELNFSYEITLIELNNLLCFLVKEAETFYFNIVDQQGYGCSFEDEPIKYYNEYKGLTQSFQTKLNNLYLIPKKNLNNVDPSLGNLKSIFEDDTLQIKESALERARINYGIQFIEDAKYQKKFNYTEITQGLNQYEVPTILKYDISETHNAQTNIAQIQMNNIQLSSEGVIYVIIEKYRQFIDYSEQDTQKLKVVFNPSKTPSFEQIFNCENGYGDEVISCQRFFLKPNQIGQITFDDLEINHEYIIYIALTNNYPLRPIIGQTQQVQTIFQKTYINAFSLATITRFKYLLLIIVLILIL